MPRAADMRVVDTAGRAWLLHPADANAEGFDAISYVEGGTLHRAGGVFDRFIQQVVADPHRGGVVVVGDFERVGSSTIRRLAHWNGAQWVELGGGLSDAGYIATMALDPANGDVYLSGNFRTSGGVAIDGVGRWNASTGQWTALPRPPFNETALAVDPETRTLVATGPGMDNLVVFANGVWSRPRFANGDNFAGLEPGVLVTVPGKGVYVGSWQHPGIVGMSLHRVRGTEFISDSRVTGSFSQITWDSVRNELVICCGRVQGGPEDKVALRVSDNQVTALPNPYEPEGPWQEPWLPVRVMTGGGRTYVTYSVSEVTTLAQLDGATWATVANSVSPQQGRPVWNAATRELFVRSLARWDVVVRSQGKWQAVDPPAYPARMAFVRSADAAGTVIAGPGTSGRTFIGRWRDGRWLERFMSPEGIAVDFNDAIWDPANQRYVLAGRVAISDGNRILYHHLMEVTSSGWRPIDVGVPADGLYGKVFALDAGGCPGGILAIGELTQWGGQPAGGAGCLVGTRAQAYPALPQSTVFATAAGPGVGVRHFWMASGILRRDASGDRFVGKPDGGTGVVRDLIADERTGSLIAVGAFLSIDGVEARSAARLTRFGWVPIPGITPHADLYATWNEQERILIAGSLSDSASFPVPADALAQAQINLPPRVSSPGILSGTPEVGRTLTYSVGAATDGDGDPVRLSWRWLRDGAPIAGATGATYVVQRADRGRSISVELTASDDEEIDRVSTPSILGINRPPTAASGRVAGMEDDGFRVSLASFGATASDPDGDPLELSAPTLPTGWRTDRIDATTLTLLPPSGFSGSVRLPIALCDDLRACTTGALDVVLEPRLMARADRFALPWGIAEVVVNVLANDLYVPSRLVGGRLVVLGVTGPGQASVDTRGTATDAADDRIVFRSDARQASESRIEYLLCETDSRRCSESVLVVARDAFSGTRIDIATSRDRGHIDLRFPTLDGIAGLRVEAVGLGEGEMDEWALDADPSPSSPWDGAGTAQVLDVVLVPSGAESFIHAMASATPGTDVDLYLGIDSNGDGRASADEVVCSSLSPSANEQCDLRRPGAFPRPFVYWAMVHARSGPTRVRLQRFDGSTSLSTSTLAATAPAIASVTGELPVRLVWNDPTLLPGDARFGSLRLLDEGGRELGATTVRIERTAGEAEAYALRESEAYGFGLPAGGSHTGLYIDVPPGLDRLTVFAQSNGAFDLRAAALPQLQPDAAIPAVARAPAVEASHPRVRSVDNRAVLEVARPTAGRWYFVPTNHDDERAFVSLEVNFWSAESKRIAPGGYFNPARSGSGLFVYPASGDAAALWYTYDNAGRPTWYYLQGPRSGVAYGWSGRLYRSTWYGRSNRLVDVGRGSLMPDGTGGVIFSYSLDGQSGSEAYSWFDGGCPRIGGRQINASGHWFDPARAGSGFSIQMFPNYEFYLAFVYDAQGQPRFLVAEAGSADAEARELPLQQTTGACPFCTYRAAAPRASVGRLKRTFASGNLVEIDVEARFANGVDGVWAAIDRVIPLAGQESLQGCAAP